jgi:hypothetical protein
VSVWIDNGNGICEPGELHSLAELGITMISVQHDNLTSSFVRNGRVYASWDWIPRSR